MVGVGGERGTQFELFRGFEGVGWVYRILTTPNF